MRHSNKIDIVKIGRFADLMRIFIEVRIQQKFKTRLILEKDRHSAVKGYLIGISGFAACLIINLILNKKDKRLIEKA